MRHNYYYNDDRGAPAPSGGDRASQGYTPFGDVPPQSSVPPKAPLPPAAPPPPGQAPRRSTPAARVVVRQPGRKIKGLPIFIVLLAAIVAVGVGAGFSQNWNALRSLTNPFNREDLYPYAGGGYDGGYDEYDDELDAPNTLDRAPVGDGTVLTLTPAGETALSAGAVYDKVLPSIVSIRATLDSGTALGTGVILSSDGYILTNAHVIAGSSKVEVTLSDNSSKKGLLVGTDTDTDLAVLKVDAQDLPAAEFGDSSLLKVGDVAYAIGNPLGEELRGTITDGIISALDRSVSVSGRDMTLIQTTAALNSGNSGGALINVYGQVVGITNMKMMSYYDTIEGLGFAIPTTTAKSVVDQLIELGYVSGKPALGVTVLAQSADGDTPDGLFVTDVAKASDAYAKGIRAGYVITAVDSQEVRTAETLTGILARHAVGDAVELTVWTGSETRYCSVVLMERSLIY